MTNINVKRVAKERLSQEIDDQRVMGWELKSQNENVAIMTKPGGWGSGGMHILIAIFTIWWLFGLGNLAYALYVHYRDNSELQLKVEDLTA